MKICVIGLGYIGLPTACLLAVNGHQVIGVSRNSKIVDEINKGQTRIKENGIEKLLTSALQKGLTATTNATGADCFLLCISVDLDEKNKRCDYTNLIQAAESVASHLKPKNVVILESTVTPGTTKNILVPLLEKNGLKANKDFFVVYCPERAIPGNLIQELVNNNRIIGASSGQGKTLAKGIYSSFVKGQIVFTDETTAETVKLMENTYRDVNIALSNELANLCEKIGVDVWEAIKLANMHPRVDLHRPGPGVGGYCIQKDPWFLHQIDSAQAKLIETARSINDGRPSYVVEKLKGFVRPNSTISVFGVAFKGNVDDVRESPATEIIELLLLNGYKAKAYDPYVTDYKFELFSLEEATKDSDCILVVADHSEFKGLDPKGIVNMKSRKIFDTRNIIDEEVWLESGFDVKLLGAS